MKRIIDLHCKRWWEESRSEAR